MELKFIIEKLEKERDTIYKNNTHVIQQIDMFKEVIEGHEKSYKENKEKIKQLDYVLDKFIYKKEPL